VLAGHVTETCWLILPAFSPGKLQLGWMTPVAITAVGTAATLAYRYRMRMTGTGAHPVPAREGFHV
jgi:hypothetical protein